jgi:hypothetical protein
MTANAEHGARYGWAPKETPCPSGRTVIFVCLAKCLWLSIARERTQADYLNSALYRDIATLIGTRVMLDLHDGDDQNRGGYFGPDRRRDAGTRQSLLEPS